MTINEHTNRYYLMPLDKRADKTGGSLIDLDRRICEEIWRSCGMKIISEPWVVVIAGDSPPDVSTRMMPGETSRLRKGLVFKARVFVGLEWLLEQNHIVSMVKRIEIDAQALNDRMSHGIYPHNMIAVALQAAQRAEGLLEMAPNNEALEALADMAVQTLATARLIDASRGRR
jgi:hypothetical protein